MKIYFSRKYGPSEIIKAQEQQEVCGSKITAEPAELVKIGIGKSMVFFWPTDYSVSGFSLNEQELKIILAELKARKQ